jgi:predicted DNA-binding transcriptional regulator AlpA
MNSIPQDRRKRRSRFPPLLLRAPEAAQACGVSQATWWRWDAGGLCPTGVKIAGCRLWSRRELAAWSRHGCPSRGEWVPIWERLRAQEGRR